MGRSANCQFGRFFPHKRRHRSSETPFNVHRLATAVGDVLHLTEVHKSGLMHNSVLFGYKSITSEYKSSENILPDETTYNRFCSKTRKDASLSPKDASFLYLDKFILRRIPKRDKELPM
jgi:hypothetical protein